MKSFFYVLIAVVVIAIAGYFIFAGNKKPSSSNDNTTTSNGTTNSSSTKIVEGDITMPDAIATLYYGDGCPHCSNFEKWLQDNNYLPTGSEINQAKVDSWISSAKVKFNVKEVWYNKSNSSQLSNDAAAAGIDSSQVGVPFLYDPVAKKAYIGETDIKTFFTSQK